MSHFGVLVMGKNMSDTATLDKAMLPFHEFECTDINEYIETVDITGYARKTYEEGELDRYVLPDGERIPLSCAIVETWFRAATEEEIDLIKAGEFQKPHRSSPSKGGEWIHTVLERPEGVERKTFKVAELMTFEEFVGDYYEYHQAESVDTADTEGEHKYGFFIKSEAGDITVYKRTNPNAKWDWYQVGGRWRHSLLLKNGTKVDYAKKSDIDFYSIREENIAARREAWDEMTKMLKSICANHDFGNDEYPTDADRLYLGKLRDEQHKLWEEAGKPGRFWDFMKANVDPIMYDLMAALFDYFSGLSEHHLKFDKIEDWIDDAPSLTAFAVIKDGKWYQKGDMGWFGMSSNEVSPDEWEATVSKMIADLPEDHEIVVVDCHI